jgi:hypothetical protein
MLPYYRESLRSFQIPRGGYPHGHAGPTPIQEKTLLSRTRNFYARIEGPFSSTEGVSAGAWRVNVKLPTDQLGGQLRFNVLIATPPITHNATD